MIDNFRLQNNGLTITSWNKLVDYLGEDKCPVQNLFVDWNPIHTDDFKAGDRYLTEQQDLYETQEEEEINPWARL